jgi:WD40 repeat protein
VRVWDAGTGENQQTFAGHTDHVNSVHFSPNSQLIVSASDDATVRIWAVHAVFSKTLTWDAAIGKIPQTLVGHTDRINSAQFSPDGELVVSASKDNTMRVWDVATGEIRQTLTDNCVDGIYNGSCGGYGWAEFSPDGRQIVCACCDSTVCVWNSELGESSALRDAHAASSSSLQLSSQTWRFVKWRTFGTTASDTIGHTGPVVSVQFSPDGELVVSTSEDKTVCVWHVATSAKRKTLVGHTERVKSAQFVSDGQKIVSTSDDGTVRLWSVSGEDAQTLRGHPISWPPVRCGVLAPFSTRSQRRLNRASGIGAQHVSAQFSPDGRQIVSGAGTSHLHVWDTPRMCARGVDGSGFRGALAPPEPLLAHLHSVYANCSGSVADVSVYQFSVSPRLTQHSLRTSNDDATLC